jgi:uncharacterized RDD family membrane protein YckC
MMHGAEPLIDEGTAALAMEYEDQRTIATPEGVQLALPLAGIGSRFMALMIDSIIGGAVATLVFVVALAIGGEVASGIVAACSLLVFYIGYHVLFEVAAGGRTLGKRASGLRVVKDGGSAVGLRASLIRNIMRLPEGMLTFYVPAMISVLVTRNNQRLGDLAAGTLVVREARAPSIAVAGPPPAAALPPERYASWDVTGVGDVESTAVRAFLERRNQLEPGARAALAAQLAGRLRPLVAGARPGLGDETFLEHLAAAKARGRLQDHPEHRR